MTNLTQLSHLEISVKKVVGAKQAIRKKPVTRNTRVETNQIPGWIEQRYHEEGGSFVHI
jgi:hypothetical protein